MPSGRTEKQFLFETTGETLNAIKNDQLEMIRIAWDERERSALSTKVRNCFQSAEVRAQTFFNIFLFKFLA